jgi:hypothetical protein
MCTDKNDVAFLYVMRGAVKRFYGAEARERTRAREAARPEERIVIGNTTDDKSLVCRHLDGGSAVGED